MTAPTWDPQTAEPSAWDSAPGPTPPTSASGPGSAASGPFGPAATAWFDGEPRTTTRAPSDPFSAPPGAPTPPPPSPLSSSPPPTRHGGGGRVALALLAAAGLLGTGWFGAKALSNPTPTTPAAAVAQPAAQPGQATPPVAADADEPAEAVAAALGPAVVQIERGDGLGSGIIYDASGLVITNAHVVGDATDVNVRLTDGTKLSGTVVGRDPSSDVAVVKVDGNGKLAVARLSTDGVRVGQSVYALGSPFGLQSTVTAGIVSAVDRPVDGEQGVAINMIQTDAPINPGNSGGALANRKGEIVGINTAIFSEKGENNGIGFSIPIATAKSVADKIMSGQSLAKGYLGVSTSTPTNGSSGAVVAQVADGTPAAQAGFQQGDVITAIDGQAVSSSQDLSARILAKAPGDTVSLTVERDGSTEDVQVTLGTRPQSSSSSQGNQDQGSGSGSGSTSPQGQGGSGSGSGSRSGGQGGSGSSSGSQGGSSGGARQGR